MTGPYFELSLDSQTMGFFCGFEDQLKWNYRPVGQSTTVIHAFKHTSMDWTKINYCLF